MHRLSTTGTKNTNSSTSKAVPKPSTPASGKPVHPRSQISVDRHEKTKGAAEAFFQQQGNKNTPPGESLFQRLSRTKGRDNAAAKSEARPKSNSTPAAPNNVAALKRRPAVTAGTVGASGASDMPLGMSLTDIEQELEVFADENEDDAFRALDDKRGGRKRGINIFPIKITKVICSFVALYFQAKKRI